MGFNDELRDRTKNFALRVISLFRSLPKTEKADETTFWMELLIASGIVSEKKLEALYKESIEITKILAVSRKTSKNNK
jgi:hypothetical protein